ncbi:MAG: HK97 family phage prohead protease [Rickettsiaceae bacterium]|uniref:HK97 family phage prohead protease n=1 Tax=Candidatus Megaera polyxenophila TaxID=988779 RepID=UPI001B70B333|nr:HK97 family phage prohead protease [Rickettsiaceae bacterium]WHA06695.1 HK97 family phage prohead protease [Candidatus Megaera polyxenophila]BBB56423.1 peptidase U35 [Candidatus Megaera polyxenophila]
MERGNISENFLIKAVGLENTIISGYASVFNIVDSQNDIVQKGAFEDTKPENIKLLWQHDTLKPIGIIKSLYEDDYGLKIQAEINNRILLGKETTELVRQKAIDGLSIGFCAKDFEYDNQGVRLLKKVDLMEISVVTFPANRNAGIINVKKLTEHPINRSLERIEKLLEKLVNLE